MAQYKVRFISEDGEVHEEDDLYDTEETPTNTDATSRAATSRGKRSCICPTQETTPSPTTTKK